MKIKDKNIKTVLRFIEENEPTDLGEIKLKQHNFPFLSKYIEYLFNEGFIDGVNGTDNSGFYLSNISLAGKGRKFLKEATLRHKVRIIIVTIFSIGGVALLEYIFDFISFIIKAFER